MKKINREHVHVYTANTAHVEMCSNCFIFCVLSEIKREKHSTDSMFVIKPASLMLPDITLAQFFSLSVSAYFKIPLIQ